MQQIYDAQTEETCILRIRSRDPVLRDARVERACGLPAFTFPTRGRVRLSLDSPISSRSEPDLSSC